MDLIFIIAAALMVISMAGLAWAGYVQRKIDKRCDQLRQQILESH